MVEANEESRFQTDEALVEGARAGDLDAFGELIQRHYPACVRVASFMLRDKAQAQDQVQVACWKAFRHLDQYEGLAQFSSWLIHIVVNECLMMMRTDLDRGYYHAEKLAPVELPAGSVDPETQAVKRQLSDVLKREIRRIPPLLRSILVLRDIEELPMSDVAERLEITIPAAKSRLLRARIELKERVVRWCGENGYPTLTAGRLPAKSGQRSPFMT